MSGLEITVNGDPFKLRAGATVADVVALIVDDAEPKGIAVALDRCVVPRSLWRDTVVQGGSQVEVVTAAAGG